MEGKELLKWENVTVEQKPGLTVGEVLLGWRQPGQP